MQHSIKQHGDLHITYLPVSSLAPYEKNARTHSKKQIQQIAKSIRSFGFINPVLINHDKMIMAGHGRVKAARLLDMEQVPTISTSHLSDAQIRAFIIADNKIAENADWDRDILAMEFHDLAALELGDFSIDDTGFHMAEIDMMLNGLNEHERAEDIIPPIDDAPPITQSGDLIKLGRHRLLCGDALSASAYAALMGGNQAQMIFTDPPYNVPIQGHVCGNGKVKHEEFAMASGEMSDEDFDAFLHTICQYLYAHSVDGALHYICMDWRHIDILLCAGKAIYDDLKNICIWNKNNGGMGSLYRSKHEMIALFKKGSAPHINNIELGTHGRYRTNVWDYAGVNSFGENQSDLAFHPTVKPVTMIADAIQDCTKRGHIVLDPFAGSGSTLIAAEQSGRRAYCMELEPKYCDVIIARWEKMTGEKTTRVNIDTKGSGR